MILLYNTTCPSVVGLWFTSGFPWAVDYFVLWLVKMGFCQKEFEKKYRYNPFKDGRTPTSASQTTGP